MSYQAHFYLNLSLYQKSLISISKLLPSSRLAASATVIPELSGEPADLTIHIISAGIQLVCVVGVLLDIINVYYPIIPGALGWHIRDIIPLSIGDGSIIAITVNQITID
jgi:hypothetical protein